MRSSPTLGVGQNAAGDALVVRGYAQAAGLPTDPNALISLMPPSVQSTISSAQATYGQLQPAIDLVGKVSSGQVDEAAAIAGVSAAAGFVGGPVAGAAMAVAGSIITGAESLMKAFFDLLGLYDHPRDVSMCGLIPSGSIPYGRDDPNWIRFDTPTDLWNWQYSPTVKFRQGNVALDWGGPTDVRRGSLLNQWLYAALGILHPDDSKATGELQTTNTNPSFEKYFATLLKTDLEKWANCNPYIPPRQLLFAAQAAWNQANSGPAVSFQPVDFPWDPTTSLVSSVLGNMGDPALGGSRAPPLSVNGVSATATAKKTSGAAKKAVIAAPATIAIGTLVYATIVGRSVDSVLSGMWRAAKGFFHKVAGETEHLAENPISLLERQSTTVQSLLFPRPEFTPATARSWARREGYRAGKVHVTTDYVRLRQRSPEQFRRGSFRTISFGRSGIKAVIGHLRTG